MTNPNLDYDRLFGMIRPNAEQMERLILAVQGKTIDNDAQLDYDRLFGMIRPNAEQMERLILAVKERGSGGGTGGGADWNAEQGESGFIANKPFKATVTEGRETMFDGQVQAEYMSEGHYTARLDGVLFDGSDIIVTVNGTEYQLSNISTQDPVYQYGAEMDPETEIYDFTTYPISLVTYPGNPGSFCASNVQNFSLKIQKNATVTDIYMSDEFETVMADRVGYTVKEESNVLFDGPLTGSQSSGINAYVANIELTGELGGVLNVTYTKNGEEPQTFTGLEPRQSGTQYTYGAQISEGVDYSEYPFVIDGSGTSVQVLSKDESYTITIESAASPTTTVETTENFRQAVKSVAGEGGVVIQGTDANGDLVTGATVQGGIASNIDTNNKNVASGPYSHAENGGYYDDGYDDYGWFPTKATGASSHAEGLKTVASGAASHAEGRDTNATGDEAHAEGVSTTASGGEAHAEGENTTASGSSAHAEGGNTTASGNRAHAEGNSTTASAYAAHAEGKSATASGDGSHAEGLGTIANHASQHVFGEYNVADTSQAAATARGEYIEIVGNGTSSGRRGNARTLKWNGDEYLAGRLECPGVQCDEVIIGQTSLTEAQLQALLGLLNT